MRDDFRYYRDNLGLSCSYEDLNESFICNLIDEKLNVIDSSSEKSINDYLYAIGMLEWWLEVNKSPKYYKEVFGEYLTEKYKQI
jgi:hypothetical protein